jgi:hypothetical protein
MTSPLADGSEAAESIAFTYGIFLRLLGLLYAGACAMLIPQIKALAGHRGIQPAQTRIHRILEDFPQPMCYVRFPSWLFLVGHLKPKQFDTAMQVLLAVGTAAGCAIALGVGDSRVWMFVCWSIYLSFANMVHLLIYP